MRLAYNHPDLHSQFAQKDHQRKTEKQKLNAGSAPGLVQLSLARTEKLNNPYSKDSGG